MNRNDHQPLYSKYDIKQLTVVRHKHYNPFWLGSADQMGQMNPRTAEVK